MMTLKRNFKLHLIVLASASLLFNAACTDPRTKARKAITGMEDEMFADTTGLIDQVKADELIRAYIDFADTCPDDTAAATYLFKAGELMMNMSNPAGAIGLFERVTNDYPGFAKADVAFFLQAFVYENNLGNMSKAAELYRAFLGKFPASDFADDAEVCLQNLGKSPEELIREFEQREAGITGAQPDTGAASGSR
jgi:outer membrane protein assembly factor BamD (BamD/ComL family)